MNIIDDKELYRLACEARKASYSPYSRVSVGAALLTESGKVYTGANIENSAYPMTVCAERVAIFKAISDGERKFKAIAVAGGRMGENEKSIFPPCGACRQVMREFCSDDFKVILDGAGNAYTLGGLLPLSFGGEHL